MGQKEFSFVYYILCYLFQKGDYYRADEKYLTPYYFEAY